uniref:NADH-ubiquinone oxidoreductase chain 3 n=1 Tax=Brachycerus muricatus TaxID=159793 RepID=J9PHC7_9CUCU|nr:NADH dehydrogenase subunit 3 [Brachycerus muricatus]
MMKMIMLLSNLILLIVILISLLMIFLNKKTFSDREKNSPFECGFDPETSARLPFSLHFFLIAIIFLIFDVELVILLPMILVFKITNIKLYTLSFMLLTLILILGIFHEWKQGALEWQMN